jgi:hypothetical protein
MAMQFMPNSPSPPMGMICSLPLDMEERKTLKQKHRQHKLGRDWECSHSLKERMHKTALSTLEQFHGYYARRSTVIAAFLDGKAAWSSIPPNTPTVELL